LLAAVAADALRHPRRVAPAAGLRKRTNHEDCKVMETFFITLGVIAFSALVVYAFVIEPRLGH